MRMGMGLSPPLSVRLHRPHISSFVIHVNTGNNLFHWEIRIMNIDASHPLGQDLINYTLANAGDDQSIFGENGRIVPAHIVFEVKLPPRYPEGSPFFRLVAPRFLNNPTPGEPANDESPGSLSMSMLLENREWGEKRSLIDICQYLRSWLLTAQNLKIDMESSRTGIPTEVRYLLPLLLLFFLAHLRRETIGMSCVASTLRKSLAPSLTKRLAEKSIFRLLH